MKAIDKIEAHFQSLMDEDLKSFEVEAWGITVYYTYMNLMQQDKITKFVNIGSLEANIEILIQLARNEDGTQMFSSGDRTTLKRRADPRVIQDVATAISDGVGRSDQGQAIEEAEKN